MTVPLSINLSDENEQLRATIDRLVDANQRLTQDRDREHSARLAAESEAARLRARLAGESVQVTGAPIAVPPPSFSVTSKGPTTVMLPNGSRIVGGDINGPQAEEIRELRVRVSELEASRKAIRGVIEEIRESLGAVETGVSIVVAARNVAGRVADLEASLRTERYEHSVTLARRDQAYEAIRAIADIFDAKPSELTGHVRDVVRQLRDSEAALERLRDRCALMEAEPHERLAVASVCELLAAWGKYVDSEWLVTAGTQGRMDAKRLRTKNRELAADRDRWAARVRVLEERAAKARKVLG